MTETNKNSQSKKKPIRSKVATTPKGVNNENFIDWYQKEERRVDDLSLQDYRDMLNDGQISMLWNATVNTILSAGFSIQDDEAYKSDNPKENSEEYEFIKRNLLETKWKGGLSKSLTLTTKTMLRAFIEGYRVFEVIHRVNDEGQIELDRLAPRAGKTDHEITLLVNDEGEFDGFKQQMITKPDINHEIIVRNDGGVNKVIKSTYGEEFGSLYGRSGFKSIWYHYDKAHKGMYLNHVGHELGAVKFRKVVAKTSDEEKIQEFVNILELVGVETVVAYKEDDFELTFETASDAAVMSVGKEMINLHYDLIAKAFLLQFINLGSSMSETGSRSLGETGKDFFKEGLQQLATMLVEDPLNEVIADLMKLNFNRDIYPKFTINPIDDALSQLLLDMFLDMAKTGKVSKSINAKIQSKASTKLDLGIEEELIQEELEEKAQEAQKMKDAFTDNKNNNQDPTKDKKVNVKEKKPTNKGDEVKLSDHGHTHIHLSDSEAVESERPVQRELFADEKKVRFSEIKDKLDESELRGERLLRIALQRQKNEIIDQYKKAIKKGQKAINAVEVNLSDKPKYSEQLLALAFELHEYGKITAANELNKPVPSTSNDKKKELSARVQNTIAEQTARLKFRLTNVANDILRGNIELSDSSKNIINLAESSAGQSMLENEYDTFFNSNVNIMLSAVGTDSFNEGRATTFDAYGDEIVAYRYVAVLDDQTTDFCRALDGSIFEILDPDLAFYKPPNHYRCRSILVGITKAEFETQGLKYTGAPEKLPEFGSKNQFKDIISDSELIANKSLKKLKDLGVLPEGDTVAIKDGVVVGSENVYNKILENITNNLTGQEQKDALQALYDILPLKGKDPVADSVRNVLESIYGIKPSKLGVNIPNSLIKETIVDNTISGLLNEKGINVIMKDVLKDGIEGIYDGNNILLKNGLQLADQNAVFLHEVGHLIDEVLGADGELFSRSAEFTKLMNVDRNIMDILSRRLNTEGLFTSEQFRNLIFTGSGRTIAGKLLQLDSDLRFYYTSAPELFAEGFRLYREGDRRFKFNALLYSFYDSIYKKLTANYG